MIDDPNFAEVLARHTDGFLAWATEAAKGVGQFAAEQTPLYIQEYLLWEFWENAMWSGFGLLLMILMSIISVIGFRGWRKTKWDDCGWVPVAIVPILVGIVGGSIFLAHIGDAVKVKIAPRVVLVEKMTEMAKRLK